jgi:putative FmdB family regulatory protein
MIYEYACNDCNHRFEVWAKVSDPAPNECPECQSSQLEKVIFATNFALKGSGWYTSDYKRAAKPAAASSEASSPVPSAEAASTHKNDKKESLKTASL